MQPVGADDEVKITGLGLREAHTHAIGVFIDGGNGITEDRFDVVLNRGVDGGGQVAARQAGEFAARRAPERLDAQAGPDLAVGSDRADRLHLIAGIADGRLDSHQLRDAVAHPPEIDHVAAGAKVRRPLDQRRLMAGSVQPVRQRRARHTGSADRDFHAVNPSDRADSDVVGGR